MNKVGECIFWHTLHINFKMAYFAFEFQDYTSCIFLHINAKTSVRGYYIFCAYFMQILCTLTLCAYLKMIVCMSWYFYWDFTLMHIQACNTYIFALNACFLHILTQHICAYLVMHICAYFIHIHAYSFLHFLYSPSQPHSGDQAGSAHPVT